MADSLFRDRKKPKFGEPGYQFMPDIPTPPNGPTQFSNDLVANNASVGDIMRSSMSVPTEPQLVPPPPPTYEQLPSQVRSAIGELPLPQPQDTTPALHPAALDPYTPETLAEAQFHNRTPVPPMPALPSLKQRLKEMLIGKIPFYGPAYEGTKEDERQRAMQDWTLQRLTQQNQDQQEREMLRPVLQKSMEDKMKFDQIVNRAKSLHLQLNVPMNEAMYIANRGERSDQSKIRVVTDEYPNGVPGLSDPYGNITFRHRGQQVVTTPTDPRVIDVWPETTPGELKPDTTKSMEQWQYDRIKANQMFGVSHGHPPKDAVEEAQARQEYTDAIAKSPAEKTYPIVTLRDPIDNMDHVFERRPEGLVEVSKVGGGKLQPKLTEADKKIWDEPLKTDEILSRMIHNRKSAETENNAQADVSLLFDHMAMTIGSVKGAKLNQDEINRAITARPWLQGLYARYKAGTKGPFLSPEQRKFMVELGIRVRNEKWTEAKRKAASIGIPMNAYPTSHPELPPLEDVNQIIMVTPDGKEWPVAPENVEAAKKRGAKVKGE